MFLLQSHQARIATLYLPTFGLLIENAYRIDVKDVSPFPINASSSVSNIFLLLKLESLSMISNINVFL